MTIAWLRGCPCNNYHILQGASEKTVLNGSSTTGLEIHCTYDSTG